MCPTWNTLGFFKEASLDDVVDCLSKGKDPNAKDSNGLTPLFWAVDLSKTPEVVKVLLDAGADFNTRNVLGSTPLHWAAQFSQTPEMVEVLLEAGADPNTRTDAFESTPLHFAVRNTKGLTQAIGAVEVLLDAGADPTARNASGKTAWDRIPDRIPDDSLLRDLLKNP
ncbi:ankyrin repeat domain-containing protein [Candidatus Synechococcus spongiarum]|uniref:ankyrin repeat domain-containing protein n=1 Tax=Candidatus Synechococcus spongiarum TaxID=431041 RepID=UPI000906F8BD|nr:ankyrin repeat domain-containing protein [Candidatus Synechococcus spongiarum]